MSHHVWLKEYCAHLPEPSPGERRAVELWYWYYVTCEDYDRSVCSDTGPTGEAWPATPAQRSLVSRNAMRSVEQMLREMDNDGVSREQSDVARRRVQRWDMDEMRRHAVGPKTATTA